MNAKTVSVHVVGIAGALVLLAASFVGLLGVAYGIVWAVGRALGKC